MSFPLFWAVRLLSFFSPKIFCPVAVFLSKNGLDLGKPVALRIFQIGMEKIAISMFLSKATIATLSDSSDTLSDSSCTLSDALNTLSDSGGELSDAADTLFDTEQTLFDTPCITSSARPESHSQSHP